MAMSNPDSPPASAVPLEDSILDVLGRTSGTLSPPEIAHAITPDGDWHALLMPIQRVAVTLAMAGRLVIYRKGKPADPQDFRGVYRLGLPRQD
jgi:hypothetical protein